MEVTAGTLHIERCLASVQEGSFEFSSHRGPKLNLSTERVTTVGFVWTRLGGDIQACPSSCLYAAHEQLFLNDRHRFVLRQDTRCLLVTTTRFRMILLRAPDRASAMPQPADLHVLSEPRNMQDLKRVIFDLRTLSLLGA